MRFCLTPPYFKNTRVNRKQEYSFIDLFKKGWIFHCYKHSIEPKVPVGPRPRVNVLIRFTVKSKLMKMLENALD